MTNRILLGAIVEREGRILLIRQTPRSPWELPGGELQQRQTDADAAMAEALETFGIGITEPEERFIETLYLPEGDGQIIYNLYAATEWTGEPEIPIGMGAGWYAFDELAAISMQEEVRNAILVAFGLKDAPNPDTAILQAMAGASAGAAPQQPALGALPTLATTSPWAPPSGTSAQADEFAEEEAPRAEALREEPMDTAPSDESPFAKPDTTVEPDFDVPHATFEDTEVVAEALEIPETAQEDSFAAEEDATSPEDAGEDEEPVSTLARVADSISREPAPGATPEPVIGGTFAVPPAAPSLAPSRRERGLDVLRTLGNASDGFARLEAMRKQYPELADDVVDFAMGDVWSGAALSRRERSLLVVAMLSAMGGRPGPLASHLNGALNHGATPDELVETLRMVAVYAGFPAALEAWKIMETTFANRGEFPSGRQQ